jgi:hypothetical protein
MRLAILSLALLVACDGDSDSSSPTPRPRPSTDWQIGPVIDGKNYSVGMPLNPEPFGEGFNFVIGPKSEPHYVTRPTGPLDDASAIRMRYRVAGPPETTFSSCASVTVHFQRRGDDWQTDGYRWWATFATVPLARGEHEIVAPLDGKWTGTFAVTAETHPAAFALAKAEAARVGFTFGDCEGYGHGATATPDVLFAVTEFAVL